MVDRERCPEAFRRWLKTEFEARGWSLSDVARKAGGITASTLDRVLNEGEHASWDFIASMAKILDEDLSFVAWKAGRWDSPPGRSDSPVGEPSEDAELLEAYERLTPADRELALLMIRVLAARGVRRGGAEADRLTPEEIRRLDGGRFTLGSAALRDAVSRALAIAPADVVEELMERCVILMPEPAERSAFLPAELVRERDLILVSEGLLALGDEVAEEEILRKVAHYWLGHRGSLSGGEVRDAAQLAERWRAGAAGLPALGETHPERRERDVGAQRDEGLRRWPGMN